MYKQLAMIVFLSFILIYLMDETCNDFVELNITGDNLIVHQISEVNGSRIDTDVIDDLTFHVENITMDGDIYG